MLKKILKEEGYDKKIILEHNETVYHMVRMSERAREFGEYLDLTEREIKILEECALLHDIGKLVINKDILYKKGKLSEEEFQLIQKHTYFEVKYCENKVFINNCIGGHHLFCKNKGYGRYNNYSETFIYTRIVSLLDVYDVMSNKRSYKNFVISDEDIIAEIIKCSGIQFDRALASKFINFINEKVNKCITAEF